ncbi:MAG TPA: ester cyclase [Chloroflexota bacterium]
MRRDDLRSLDQAQPAMPDDEIATRYCRYVDEVLNHHRLDAIAGYMAADAVAHAHGVTAGPAGPRALVGSLLGAFPDLHLTIDALAMVEGELLARLTATGTHVGPSSMYRRRADGSACAPSKHGNSKMGCAPSSGCSWT